MSAKIPVNTDMAPKALPGIYNQAIVAHGMVFCSGAVALDKHTGRIIDGDVKAHTQEIIKNLTLVLESAGTAIENVVKVNVFLANMDDFSAMNEVYMQYWGNAKPCRTCVAVKTLPYDTDIEIECTTVLP